MKVDKNDVERFQNGLTCSVSKYTFPSEKLGLVTAEIDGRYPETGKVLNEVSDEVYFVVSGSCTVHHADGESHLAEGDLFFFPSGRWWWVDADQVLLVVCTARPWTPEQQRKLD